MGFKSPDAGAKPHELTHLNGVHAGVVAITGTTTIDLGTGGAAVTATASFATEPGDADDVGRLSATVADGKLTITVKELVLSEGTPNTIGWATSVTPYNIAFIAVETAAIS